MKRLFAALSFALALHAQTAAVGPTTTVSISIQFPNPVLWDINTGFLSETSGSCGTLASPMLASDTVLTLNTSGVILPVSTSIEIDMNLPQAEPLSVTAVNGNSITVAPRGASASFPLATAAAHAAGATCSVLTYTNPATMITREALLPWAISKVNTLAQQGKSATLFSAVTGMTLVNQ